MYVREMLTQYALQALDAPTQARVWLAAHGETGASLARDLGVSRQLVNSGLRGHCRMSRTVREYLDDVAGIPASIW